MKKWWMIPALLAFLLLSGCGQTEQTQASAHSTVSEAALSAEAESPKPDKTGNMEAVQTENAALSNEEIFSAYARAVTAFGWFERNSLPCSEDAIQVDGTLYQKVDYAGFHTVEDLRTYLGSIFSEEIVEKLLPEDGTALYRDIDGALFVKPISRGGDPYKGDVTEMVEQVDSVTYCINVTVETLGQDQKTVTGMECFAFPYEFINDRWVFTDFTLTD